MQIDFFAIHQSENIYLINFFVGGNACEGRNLIFSMKKIFLRKWSFFFKVQL